MTANFIIGRRINLHVTYENQKIDESLTSYLTSFAFTDTIVGQGDSFSFSLADPKKKWMNEWKPSAGAELSAAATLTGWKYDNSIEKRRFGDFNINDLDIKGPPHAVTLKATSIPKGRGAKDKRTKSYTKTTLKKVASIIAGRLGLKLIYHVSESVSYDRVEQSRENDLVFIHRIASEAGCCMKVSTKYLTILDEAELEAKDSKDTISLNDKKVLDYGFTETLTGIYKKCIVSYHDSKKKTTKKVEYIAKDIIKGDTLYVDEEFKTEAKGKKIAKSKLREANKERTKASLTYIGLINRYAGDTIKLTDAGKFNGKYIITSISGTIAAESTQASVELRRCLEGY